MDKKKIIIAFGFIVSLMLSFFNAVPVGAWVYPDCTADTRYEMFGPRCDKLLINMYANLNAESIGLMMGDIDVMDWPLTKPWVDQWNQPPYNESIKLVDYGCDLDEIVLEINNNPNQYLGNPPNTLYPNPVYPNPCSVSSFRHALAHLMDRNWIIANIDGGLGIPIYTEVPPFLGVYQHTGIFPGGIYTPGEDLSHPFNLTEAARLLVEDGFPIGPDGWRYWDRNGNSVKDPGEDLVLKFVIRVDDDKKRHIGDWYADQLQNPPIQIHVDRLYRDRIGCIIQVMENKDFHLFTGDRNLRKDPDYLYEMKHSQMYWHPGICPNYIFFNNTEYDYWAERLKFANTYAEALEAAYKCQEIYATPCKIGSIPIECRVGIKAMKRCYSGGTGGIPVSPDDGENQYRCQSWKGFVNGYWAKCSCGGAMGINSWWTFLNAYPEGHLMGDCQHMTMRYGFSAPTLWSLNPIYANDYWEWEVLNKIYDTLLKEDPYTLEDIPWIAKNWEIGTWIDPTTGEEKTKIRLTLQSSVAWQDGTPLTVADVKFTIEELPKILAERGLPPPWWHQKVKFVKSCDIIDACNIEVLFDVKSIWALHWVGELKILPKHIWKPIVETGDPTGFAPDPNLIGCGPWRLSVYDPVVQYILLVANKPCQTITTNLPGSVPVHSSYGYFRWRPIHVNVHISDPPEYRFAQRVQPYMDFTVNVTLHNEWVNPIPNSAGAPPHGLLTAHKIVWIVYTNGTERMLADDVVDLPYCSPFSEYFGLNLSGCSHNQIKVAVHIEGPAEIEVTKAGGTIIVPNPWMNQWINYTFDFWVTIREDIVGSTYYDDVGLPSYPYKSQLPTPDGEVDMEDINTCTGAWASYPGHPRWNSLADVIRDYHIDIHDIYTIALWFGWRCGMPLVPPTTDVAVLNVKISKTVVCQGYTMKVNATVQNQGGVTIDCNVTVYANSTPIGSQVITLSVGVSTTLTFTWNTSGFAKGNYALSAEAWPTILFDSNTTNNNFTDGWVIVSMVGDVTGPDGWPDGKCDMLYDIRSVAKLFGVVYPDPRYVANYDINDDGQIDMLNDIRTVAKHFGEEDP
jgi:peptide/nickel transport system substrate-binding protein